MNETKLGLKENWVQFSILVIVNAFVGGMVGLERTIFPQLAEEKFAISSSTAILSFIVAFGITKAISNYFAGILANKIGRKNLLVIGWLFALPIPFILINATSWNWIVFANVLLGINQGLCWSSTVVMKIDLVGNKDRGLAMGINEFAGYLAVGLVAFLSGYIANNYGVSPYPFYIGVVLSSLGFIMSILFIKDTKHHLTIEQSVSSKPEMKNIFYDTTIRDKTLSSITQAGLVNNLNDGMIWGLLPIMLLSLSYNQAEIGIIVSIYPIVWGLGQLFTGKMSDIYNKKKMLFWGMFMQGMAIILIPYFDNYLILCLIATFLGLGTALVYPTFLSSIAQAINVNQRAETIGVFRFWRDLGYAFGALISGIVADLFGIPSSIILIGIITLISALIIKIRIPNNFS